ncbi:MAG: ABC transporter ATP-binding protein [Lachnospiraceae bacterium]|nr:ABC transporter ATP-binding protein [Lachnospiraceae bacterium]
MSLEIKNVTKKFDNAKINTLEDVSLTIGESEFICVIGPSGCGKTTLLNLIAGLEKPSSGSISYNGIPITSPGPDRIVMFQESALFPWLTVKENIFFGLKLAGKSKAEQEEITSQYLKMVQLAHYRDYRPHELSGGMKQRAALARALALDSNLLLMDEPFASLDKQTRNKLREEIQDIFMQTKKTVFFITHSVEEAIFFADRIVMLGAHPGRVIREMKVGLSRPRQIDGAEFIELRANLLSEMREEVDKSVEAEYRND